MKPRILVYPTEGGACRKYRIMGPAERMSQNGYDILVSETPLLNIDPVTVVIQRPSSDMHRLILSYHAMHQDRIVVDLDDDMWNVPEWNFPPNAETLGNITECLRMADTVVVTNKVLADKVYRKTGVKDIRVVPNYIVADSVPPPRVFSADYRPKTLGWAGGINHDGDLRLLAQVLPTLREAGYRFVFYGNCPKFMVPVVDRILSPVPIEKWESVLAASGIEIALCPLDQNEVFNLSKSDLKVKEFAHYGIPSVTTKLHPYDAHPGLSVEWTPEKVLDAVNCIASRYKETVSNVHAWAARRNLLSDHWREFAEAWES